MHTRDLRRSDAISCDLARSPCPRHDICVFGAPGEQADRVQPERVRARLHHAGWMKQCGGCQAGATAGAHAFTDAMKKLLRYRPRFAFADPLDGSRTR